MTLDLIKGSSYCIEQFEAVSLHVPDMCKHNMSHVYQNSTPPRENDPFGRSHFFVATLNLIGAWDTGPFRSLMLRQGLLVPVSTCQSDLADELGGEVSTLNVQKPYLGK